MMPIPSSSYLCLRWLMLKPRKFMIEQTLIAARWIVWGIQCIWDFWAENSMPASWHWDSIVSIMVSLLLALSIMIAIIWETLVSEENVRTASLNIPYFQSHKVPMSTIQQLPYFLQSVIPWPHRNQSKAPLHGKWVKNNLKLKATHTILSIISHIMSNNCQKCITITRCPSIDGEADFSFKRLHNQLKRFMIAAPK